MPFFGGSAQVVSRCREKSHYSLLRALQGSEAASRLHPWSNSCRCFVQQTLQLQRAMQQTTQILGAVVRAFRSGPAWGEGSNRWINDKAVRCSTVGRPALEGVEPPVQGRFDAGQPGGALAVEDRRSYSPRGSACTTSRWMWSSRMYAKFGRLRCTTRC